jgi:hypothetical protein
LNSIRLQRSGAQFQDLSPEFTCRTFKTQNDARGA